MAGIEEKKLRPLWAEHYPKWRESSASRDVCLAICRIIEEQAARLTASNYWSVKLSVTLASYNIPEDQFVEFVNNTPEHGPSLICKTARRGRLIG
jgi:hypothetical protein